MRRTDYLYRMRPSGREMIIKRMLATLAAITIALTFSMGTSARAQDAAPAAAVAPGTPAPAVTAPAEAGKQVDGEKEKKGKKGKKESKGKKKDQKKQNG